MRDPVCHLVLAGAGQQVVGLGLDEDTAAFIDPQDRIEVVGAGAITVVDAAGLEHSSVSSAEVGQPIFMTGVRVHVLPNGATFDLKTRRAAPPDGET